MIFLRPCDRKSEIGLSESLLPFIINARAVGNVVDFALNEKECTVSVQIEIHELKNLTSGLNLLKDFPPELLEYDKSSFLIETKDHTSTLGQLVSISCTIHFGDEKIDFAALGKVGLVTPCLEKKVHLLIRLHQYDRFTWKRLVDTMNNKQKRVDSILKAVKGDD